MLGTGGLALVAAAALDVGIDPPLTTVALGAADTGAERSSPGTDGDSAASGRAAVCTPVGSPARSAGVGALLSKGAVAC
jgi:hypothetical protein